MKLRTRLVAALSVSCLPIVVQQVTAWGQDGTIEGGTCTRPVGDLNGDGLTDYAVSDRSEPAVAHILFGRRGSSPSPAFVLRGPRAAPFVCPDGIVPEASHQPVAAAPVSTIGGPLGQPPPYVIVDFDPIQRTSVASGINAYGQVVGRATFAGLDHAFVYDASGVRDLGTLGGHLSEALDINDKGAVVGHSLTGAVDALGFVHAPFTFDGGAMRSLNLDWSTAQAINGSGLIAGETRVAPNVHHAFLYQHGAVLPLGSLPPRGEMASSAAYAINTAGQIVGESGTFVIAGILYPLVRHQATHAFLYDHGVMRDLGTLGVSCVPIPQGGERCTDQSTATDINTHGQIVGYSTAPGIGTRAVTLAAGQAPRVIGTLGTQSWAYGVNDSGQIVGMSQDNQPHYAPFLYERGTMYNLRDLLVNPPETLPFAAYDINNFGQIAGNHHLLTPVYQTAAPGRDLSFTTTLGTTLTFEYWAQRDTETCRSARKEKLRVEVKIDAAGETWAPLGAASDCDEATDWSRATVTSAALVGRSSSVHIRVRASTATTPDTLVYVRHVAVQ